ncbi:MAG: hypothetical protein ACPLUL_14430, partial [Thermanaerothrix sp.]
MKGLSFLGPGHRRYGWGVLLLVISLGLSACATAWGATPWVTPTALAPPTASATAALGSVPPTPSLPP